MKKKKDLPIHPAVENVRKIIKDRGITQIAAAELAGTSSSQMSKILSGEVQMSLWQISNFAKHLDMDVIDVFTYPHKYTPKDDNEHDNSVEAVLQIKLKAEKKEEVLRLIFGDNDLEILKK